MPYPILPACEADLPAILALQYQAFQSEAELLGKMDIPPLRQTLDELREEFQGSVILKAVDLSGQIVGSVRGQERQDTLYIGKLMVRPDRQGQGLGFRLLAAMEAACPTFRYELFTSAASQRNLALYERAGYRRFRQQEIATGVAGVFLEKSGQRPDQARCLPA